MRYSEVRIGNLVYDTEGKVNTINLDAITYLCKEPKNQVKPVPLSEEWLIKAGFEKCINGYWSPNEMFNVKFYDDGNEVYLSGGDVNIAVKPLKYLHEAQNLYYSIFGEELEFKL